MNFGVLLCEADQEVAQSARDILTVEGFDVMTVASAREAIAALRTKPWAFVLIGLDQPPLDRAELLEGLRSLPLAPTIAFCGDTESPDANRLATALGHDILGKPLEPTHLVELVTHSVDAAREHQAELAVLSSSDVVQADTAAIETEPGVMTAPALDAVLSRAADAASNEATDRPAGPKGESPPSERAESTEEESIFEKALSDLEQLSRVKESLTGAFEGLRQQEETIRRLVAEKEKLLARTEEIEQTLNTQLEQFQTEATQMIEAVQTERDQAARERDEVTADLAKLKEETAPVQEELTRTLQQAEILKQQQEEARGEVSQAWSTLIYAVGSLVTGLPEAAIVINKSGSIIGASRTLAATMGTQANKLIGQSASTLLTPALQNLLARAAEPFEEEGLSLEISAGAGATDFDVQGLPIKSGKAGLRALFLRDPRAAVAGKYKMPEGDISCLVEDFKEKLFSIRLLTDTISTRAESEKIRAVAKDVTSEVDNLVEIIDRIFQPSETP